MKFLSCNEIIVRCNIFHSTKSRYWQYNNFNIYHRSNIPQCNILRSPQCNILAIPIKNYSNAIFFVVQFQQRIIPQRNILYTIPTTNYFIIHYSLCNSNNELFHNEIISAQFHQRIIPMQYFSCNSNNKLFRSKIFFMQFHQWIILQCNIFHSAIPTKNYSTTKYSLRNSINELSHSAIFFVQFQQRIIPRCNILYAIPSMNYSTV